MILSQPVQETFKYTEQSLLNSTIIIFLSYYVFKATLIHNSERKVQLEALKQNSNNIAAVKDAHNFSWLHRFNPLDISRRIHLEIFSCTKSICIHFVFYCRILRYLLEVHFYVGTCCASFYFIIKNVLPV